MAHEIETHGNQAAAIFARVDAWHKLGVTMPEEFTAEQAMEFAHLGGWNIRKTPIRAVDITDEGVTEIDVPDRFATVRTNPFTGASEALGVVGNAYHPIQNEEHCELLNTLVDETGAIFDTAGSLRGGREVFVSMKLPETMLVGGVDPVDLNLIALNSHDGSSSFRLMLSPVRVVCANTQAAALGNNNGIYRIRHTVGAKGAIEDARQSLGMSFKYLEGFQEEAERMIETTMSEGEFFKIVKREFGAATDASERAKTNSQELIDGYMHLFTASPTNAEIRGTNWAAYQVFTEHMDHYSTVRGDDKAAARAERALSVSVMDVKRRAFDLFKVGA